jgi:trans-2,3-dihydro-3-hydroxyanthranilate isomerase
MNRKSYIKLDGTLENEKYNLKVGGQVVDVSKGKWNI